MSRLFGPQHRELQDHFESRKMADRIEQVAAKTEIDEAAKAFIESRDMFFLSTVDHQGRPTVSYKGGAPGLVKVLNPTEIAFPSYDGNGMYLSMGNINAHPEIGMLFIAFDRPFRLRLQGRAEIVMDGPEVALFKEAQLAVRVAVSDVWMNCPRYVHRYDKVAESRYVPQADAETLAANGNASKGSRTCCARTRRRPSKRRGRSPRTSGWPGCSVVTRTPDAGAPAENSRPMTDLPFDARGP